MRRDLTLALLLVAALGVAYLFGRCASERGAELSAWKDSTALARASSERATEEVRRAQLALSALSLSLDSARAQWQRAADEVRVIAGPATIGDPALDPLYVPGVNLARSCSAYQSACERAMQKADQAIDSLEHEVALLRRRPPDPPAEREAWLRGFVSGGYDLGARSPALRTGGVLRLGGDWQLSLDATRRLTAGDTTRVAAWATWKF